MSQQLTVQEERAQRLASFKKQLEIQTPAFKAMLPAHVPAEKFKRVVMTAMVNSPDLLDCTAQSILTACMRAAADGLLPDGREGAVVKFKDKAQWMPMVGGILKKLRNSGELQSINAYVVYKQDRFRYVLGDDEKIEHTPYIGDDPGEAIAVYAIARTTDGGVYREVMTRAQVEKVRAVSRSDTTKPDSPWMKWWDEKARVACIRRLSKRLPMSTDKEEDIRAMLEREDDEMQDVTPTADAAQRPTREQFQDPAGAGDAPADAGGTQGGDHVNAGKAEAPTPGASDPRAGMSAEQRDAIEREADRMQRGQDEDEGSAEEAIDLSAVSVPMKGDKPDIAAYTAAVNASLSKIPALADLAEFDAVNKPVAVKVGGAALSNYNLAVAQRRKAIGG